MSLVGSSASTELWRRLEGYTIGPDTAALSFSSRLSRENRWEAGFTSRVILEYKRFCYLAMSAVRTGGQLALRDASSLERLLVSSVGTYGGPEVYDVVSGRYLNAAWSYNFDAPGGIGTHKVVESVTVTGGNSAYDGWPGAWADCTTGTTSGSISCACSRTRSVSTKARSRKRLTTALRDTARVCRA